MATLTSIINNIIQKVNNLTSSKVSKVTSTDNAIVRYNGTTGEVQNSGVIIDDNNNVGIGLDNPHAKLGVVHNDTINTGANNNTVGSSIGIDSAGATQPILGMRWTAARGGIGGNNYTSQIVADSANSLALEMYTTGATPLIFGTNGTERMRIDDTGNVGVGVAPSAWYAGNKVLEIGTYSALYQGQGGEQNLESNSYRSAASTWTYKVSGAGASRYVNDFGKHIWYTAPSGTAGNAITWTNVMKLDSNGTLSYKINSNEVRVVSFATFTDSNPHTIALGQTMSFDIVIAGDANIRIPFFTVGGSGISWRYNYLHPINGWVYNSEGPSFSFTTNSSNPNTYLIEVGSGNANVTIQRIAGVQNYNVEVLQRGL